MFNTCAVKPLLSKSVKKGVFMLRIFLYFLSAVMSVCLMATVCLAGSSVNTPVGSPIYHDLERLEVKGLLDSAMLSTKPFGRLEGARLVKEAEEKEAASGKDGEEIILRLKNLFKDELEYPGVSYFKPLDSVYLKAGYAANENPFFLNVNNNGDSFIKGGNLRAGLSMRGGLFDIFSLYLNPEYRLDKESGRGTLILGYITIDMLGATIELGRDSMWWGPGFNGDLLLTNNAKPFDMIKLTSQHPFLLPWVFKYIGIIKPTIFLTHLDENMNFPKATILGMRLDFKPTPHLEFGMTRLFLNGGHGRKSLTLSDWWQLFLATNKAEHSGGPIDGSQMASIDASYVYVNARKWVPFSGTKLYAERGAIDSSGIISPTGYASMYGAFIDEPLWLKDTDLRVEWANTAHNARYGPSWYNSGIYSTGWRYEGNIIGHHMGGDARDLFARVQYHYKEKATCGVEGDWERSGFHSGSMIEKRWFAIDGYYYPTFNTMLQIGAGYQNIKNQSVPDNGAGAVVWSKATLEF